MSRRRNVLAAVCSALAFGCADQQHDRAGDTQEIVDNLVQAGYLEDDIMVVDGVVYVGRDAEVNLEASREMLGTGSSSKEQYRTSNLVSLGVATICIDGSAFTSFSAKFSSALDLAIGNYNALGLSFRLVRTSGSTTGCNALITARVSTSTGGSAGFPSGGLPFNTINIGSGLNSSTFGVDTVEHVITHELGHCIGLRHSDWFNRSISCGSGGTEGAGTVGAIHIPGPPTGAIVGGSVMNACFRTIESGEFTSSDIAALIELYSRCGDGVCSPLESCSTCSFDCGPCFP
jgi:hypothetical protein